MEKKEKKPREYRGVRDEIREQQEKTKDMSLKGKLSYFWYYYKVHTLVAVVVIGFVVSLAYTMLTTKDFCFYGIMLNANQLSGSQLAEGFAGYAQLDTENYECFIDTDSTLSLTRTSEYDMATSQKLIALMQTKDLDAVVFDSQVFFNYSFNEMFTDLRTVFSEEELAAYHDFIYYIDYAEIREADAQEYDEVEAFDEHTKETPEDIAAEAELHRHPETMEEPVPVGIFLTDSAFAQKTGAYDTLTPVFGIPVSAKRVDTAKAYLQFLWDDSVSFEEMRLEFN